MLNEHEVVCLFYNKNINRFIDEFGDVVHDIFRFITPGQLMIFKEKKDIFYVVSDVTNSFLVKLMYYDEK